MNVTNFTKCLSLAFGFKLHAKCPDVESLVNQTKSQFYVKYAKEKEAFDTEDVKLIVENSHLNYVQRYLERQNYDVNRSLDQLVRTLKWRKSVGIAGIRDNAFPDLCYRYGCVFLHGVDKESNTLLCMRVKLLYNYHQGVYNTFDRFFAHLIFKADQSGAERGTGWTLVIDLTDASARHFDFTQVVHLLKLYVDYCPSGLKKIVLYNMPSVLKPIVSAALSIMPQSVCSSVIVVDGERIFDVISPDNLPICMGGASTLNVRTAPKGCPTIEDYVNRQFPGEKGLEEAVSKFEEILKKDQMEENMRRVRRIMNGGKY